MSSRPCGLLLVLLLITGSCMAQTAPRSWEHLLLERLDGSGHQRILDRSRVLNILTTTDTLRGMRFTGRTDRTFHFMDLDSVEYAVDTGVDTIQRIDAVWFGPVTQRFIISGFGSVLLGAALTVPYAGLVWAIEDKQAAMDALKVGGILLVIGLPPIYLVTRKTRLDMRTRWRALGRAER